jgi:hypothetical protein
MMVARFRTSGSPCAECQDRALARTEQQTYGHDLEPRSRRRFPAHCSPRDVDHDPIGTIVP